MKMIWLALALWTSTSLGMSEGSIEVPLVGVVDGDTLITDIPQHPPSLRRMLVRIYGIDTPEKRKGSYKCEKEKALAIKATNELKDYVANHKTMILTTVDFDKYGGRLLAEVIIGGQNIADWLIEKGYAQPYFGKGPKPDWCQ